MLNLECYNCVKSVHISGPHFLAFGPNTYSLRIQPLHIQSECWKIVTRKSPNTDTFHAVYAILLNFVNFLQYFVQDCFFKTRNQFSYFFCVTPKDLVKNHTSSFLKVRIEAPFVTPGHSG